MRSDQLQDALSFVNEKYIADAHGETQGGRRPMARWGALAACLVLVAGLGIGLSRRGMVQPPVDVTAPPSQTVTPTVTPAPPQPTQDTTPAILWPEQEVADGGVSEMYIPFVQYGEKVSVHPALQRAMDGAGEDEPIAFLVMVYGSLSEEAMAEQDALLATLYQPADENLTAVIQSLMEEMTADGTMSTTEAQARKFNHPDFIAAWEAERAAYAELVSRRQLIEYREKGHYFEALAELGFTLICDPRDEEWQAYLGVSGSMGILAGTREQIAALAEAELDCSYVLYPAAEEGKHYVAWDFYSETWIDLPDGSKLTRPLMEAYAQADGQPLEVIVQFGYLGREYSREELDAAGAAALGMTVEEFWARQDLTHEQVDLFLKTRNDLIYHRAEKEAWSQRVFRDGELTEDYDSPWSFTAVLTYERAMEICEDNETAYIRLRAETQRVTQYGFDDLVTVE